MSNIKIDNKKVWLVVVIVLLALLANNLNRHYSSWGQVRNVAFVHLLFITLPVVLVVALMLYFFNRDPRK